MKEKIKEWWRDAKLIDIMVASVLVPLVVMLWFGIIAVVVGIVSLLF